jgi:hypothetical protein
MSIENQKHKEKTMKNIKSKGGWMYVSSSEAPSYETWGTELKLI